MPWHMHQMGTGAWIYLIILIVFFIIAGIYIISQKDNSEDCENEPIEILKKRYARGEISKQEYEEMKKNLSEE